MPGLRYPAGMNSWAKYGGDHRESLVSGREVGGISRGLEVGRGREVVAPNQCTRGRRGAPQWLQQCREDLRDNFLGTSRHWDGGSGDGPDSGSCNSDNDLQAMVHDFIENDCVDDMDAGDGDGGSPGLSSLSDSLQVKGQFGCISFERVQARQSLPSRKSERERRVSGDWWPFERERFCVK